MATKRLYNADVYYITTERNNYAVVLERLHNDRNGNGRRKATLVFCPSADEHFTQTSAPVYTFTSNGEGDRRDAEKAVSLYEAELKRAR